MRNSLTEERNFTFTLLESIGLTEKTDADLKTIKAWLSNQPESERRENLMRRVERMLNPIELKWR